MSMLGVGCGPQVGPFPSRPIMGSIRGEGTLPPPPTNPSRHLRKERSFLHLKWLLTEGQGRSPTAAVAAARLRATAATPCPCHTDTTAAVPAAVADLASPPLPLLRRRCCPAPPSPQCTLSSSPSSPIHPPPSEFSLHEPYPPALPKLPHQPHSGELLRHHLCRLCLQLSPSLPAISPFATFPPPQTFVPTSILARTTNFRSESTPTSRQ